MHQTADFSSSQHYSAKPYNFKNQSSIKVISIFASSKKGASSTFAWFQATAEVNVETSSTSTTITVSKPDDFVFYGYNGNLASTWANKGNSFAADFTQISSSNLDAMTKFTGETGEANKFNPGDIKSFALKFTGHSSSNTIYLKIKKLICKTAADGTSNHRYDQTSGSDVEISIGWSIDIYSMYVAGATPSVSSYSTFVASTKGKTTALGSSGTDRFNFGPAEDDTTSIAGSIDGNYVRTLSTEIPVYTQPSAINDTTGYVFFSVVFNNDLNHFFKEVNNGGTTALYEPSDSTTRYFLRNTSSSESAVFNSNCFSDLTFALTEMVFRF